MMFKNLLSVAALVTVAVADYRCATNKGSFTITSTVASAARDAGGTDTNTKSRFPHGFGGMSGNGSPDGHPHEGVQIVFYGSDNRCNAKQPPDADQSNLLEFPVFQNGKIFDKNSKREDGVLTPARVVYLREDTNVLCGVMTHAVKNDDGSGQGDFRVCDSI